MYETDLDYDALLDALERRHARPRPWNWPHALGVLVAAGCADLSLILGLLGPGLPLGLVAIGILLWARDQRHRR